MKSVKISILAEESGQGWWTHQSYHEDVVRARRLAKQLFGEGGTTPGRSWFYRSRYEHVASAPDVVRRTWCDIYFRNPQDATWFQLAQQ